MFQKLRNRTLVVWLECWDDSAAVRLNTDETRWRTFCQCYNFMFAWTRQIGVGMDIVDFHGQYLTTHPAIQDQQTLTRPGNPVPRPMAPSRIRPSANRADRTSGPARHRTAAARQAQLARGGGGCSAPAPATGPAANSRGGAGAGTSRTGTGPQPPSAS
ncbi:hypothetical protein IFR04_004341 [Cadophora malorum]|uniref:Uncharacterized protein n=1 Tax=Cadophora malorum TaxID=108018 RepID=A0A8H8BSI9_9HELO|nr:hypothetical protein IFR04_004341 [Cadophora malorum]